MASLSGLADYLQDLGHVDVYAFPVPPPLFTVVAPKEQHFGPIGKCMLDLEHVVF
ncbi:MAG: hypothetical protein ACRDU9_03335 [Acidimicrobiia bacterium]